MRTLIYLFFSLICHIGSGAVLDQNIKVHNKLEISYNSSRIYENPIYDVQRFEVTFISPSGRIRKVNGFWDGGDLWKVRFIPDEIGGWKWRTICSDNANAGLHEQTGNFECIENDSVLDLYKKGGIKHLPGRYFLTYGDGTPFFWQSCTAWNGALLSTRSDWDYYLENRRALHYNAIQFVTTQWRGGAGNAEGEVAFTGSGRIEVNPEFFKKLDKKVDRINEQGLVAVPVILWALPFGSGRELSPGYHLPVDEAVKLSSYIVARYQGNHVVWFLGGDGSYYDEFFARWQTIGDRVFNDIDHAPVTLHPHGRSFVGDLYAGSEWYSIMGYQSSHSFGERTVDWINEGPVAAQWSKYKGMPWINLEPLYENIHDNQTSEHVRNAIWWSILAAPVAGVTYGANGIWSWLAKDGDDLLNHRRAPWTVSWKNSLDLPVSRQMQYVFDFFARLEWWEIFPLGHLLIEQPGAAHYDRFVSLSGRQDGSVLIAYVPSGAYLHCRNAFGKSYRASWYDPTTGQYARIEGDFGKASIRLTNSSVYGLVLLLEAN